MNKAMLDTDIFSELGKGVNQTVISNGLEYLGTFEQYTISVVSVQEIVRGLQKKLATGQLRDFDLSLSLVETLLFDRNAAEIAGRIEGKLERVGRPIGRADPMIAAIALTNDLELVTGNTAHYRRIQEIGYPLVLHNWRVERWNPGSDS